jgi:hypothetical protein
MTGRIGQMPMTGMQLHAIYQEQTTRLSAEDAFLPARIAHGQEHPKQLAHTTWNSWVIRTYLPQHNG